jgi:hypothetical protein
MQSQNLDQDVEGTKWTILRIENAIVEYLKKNGPNQEHQVYLRIGGGFLGREIFVRTVEGLVRSGVLNYQLANGRHSSILELSESTQKQNAA